MDKHLLDEFAGKQDEVSALWGPVTLPHFMDLAHRQGAAFQGFARRLILPSPSLPSALYPSGRGLIGHM